MTLDLAFLLALLGCVAFAVGWLRAEGKANRWRTRYEEAYERCTDAAVVIAYGADWSLESARQRQLRAAKVLDEARRSGNWTPALAKPKRRK